MKTLLILLGAAFSTFPLFGQGTIAFQNAPGQEITNQTTSARIPTAAGFVIGMYYGPVGTTDETSLQLLGTSVVTPVAGHFSGGTITTPNTTAPGGVAVIQIRAWSGGYATYELALAAAVGGGGVAIGESHLFNVTTGNPGGSPATTPGLLTAMAPFRVFAPEPSSFALGLLGLGALAAFRRRK